MINCIKLLSICGPFESAEECVEKPRIVLIVDDRKEDKYSGDGKDYYDYEERKWVRKEKTDRNKIEKNEREGLERPEIDFDRGKPI